MASVSDEAWNAMVERLNQIERELDESVTIINRLRRGTCWCEVAIGNPMASGHSPACIAAKLFVEGEQMGTEYSRLMEGMVDTLEARVKELEARLARAACYPASYQICVEHPDLTSPDKRLPCPACLEIARADKAEAAFGPLLPPSPEALEAYQRQAESYPESDMHAVPKQWLLNERSITERVAAGLEKERDAALAERSAMQPIEKDDSGVFRFKENRLVSYLVDTHNGVAGGGLNDLAVRFSDEEYANDWMQLAQLIGYSVSGYGDLSYVTDESYNKAARMVANEPNEPPGLWPCGHEEPKP